MRYYLTSLFLLLSLTHSVWADTARVICGKDAAFAKLKDEWKFNKKENSYCASAHCPYPDGSMWREQCIQRHEHQTAENQVTISYRDYYNAFQQSGVRSRVVYNLINKDDACFESCKPEIKGKKVVSGIDRKSCVECLKKKTAAELTETLNYPELEKPIEPGTKCYSLCSDRPGPFSAERVLTSECLSCTKERFFYIRTQSGACLEVDTQQKTRMVINKFCQEPYEVEFTEYRTKQTFWQSFTDKKGDCFEVDLTSGGGIFSRPVSQDHCADTQVNDTDRNIVKDVKKPSPGSNPKAGAQKQ